jgi:t-SNARE complex subunit (syntaxin)
MKDNIKNVIVVLVIILGGAVVYSLHIKDMTGLPNVEGYQKTIDSLNNAIELNRKEIARFDSLNNIQEEKIKKLNVRLSNTAATAAKEHKQHEEDIKRIGAMSNNDVTALFTESFD